jgi:hypothetical protein
MMERKHLEQVKKYRVCQKEFRDFKRLQLKNENRHDDVGACK